MKIKRFTGRDMRDAIRQVREEQGPDAVILSNRRVDGQVEVVAATDYDEALVQQALRAAPRKPGEEAPQAAVHAPLPMDPSLGMVRTEIAGLRVMVQRQAAAFALQQLKLSPGRAEALEELDRIGVDQNLAQTLVSSIPPNADLAAAKRLPLGLLAKHLPVTAEDPIDRGGVIALVGATGVGKTTTIAKLAARYGAKHGLRNVALVTTDHFRIGAREQLHTYGRLLGVPVHEAANALQLQDVLKKLAEYPLVLIDTAGLSPNDRQLAEQMRMLAPVQHYLVMAANCQAADLQDTVTRFWSLRPAACILTKVDETTRLGGAISVAVRNKLPVAYVCDGQRVPEDLELARSHKLVLRAMRGRSAATTPDSDGGLHAAA